jgi:hypothetical protein
MTNGELTQSPAGEFLMFTSGDGKVRIECRFENDTLWLSQAMICDLYGKAKSTISGHIKNIFEDAERTKIQLFGFTEQLPSMEKHIMFNSLVCR